MLTCDSQHEAAVTAADAIKQVVTKSIKRNTDGQPVVKIDEG
jgi:hypothetical protein